MLLKMAQHRPVPSPYVKEEHDPVSPISQFLHFRPPLGLFIIIAVYFCPVFPTHTRVLLAPSRSPTIAKTHGSIVVDILCPAFSLKRV